MGHYEKQLAIYKANQSKYSKVDFILPIAEKVLKICALRVSDAYYLFVHARLIPDKGTYLEIGSWMGGSLLCAYEGTRAAGHTVYFIAVEPNSDELLLEYTKGIPRLHHIKSCSDEAINLIKDESIDLLFVDGNHRYAQVKRDFLNYWPKIKIEGILLAHDYLKIGKDFGVKCAADEIFGSDNITIFPLDSLIGMVKKRCDLILKN